MHRRRAVRPVTTRGCMLAGWGSALPDRVVTNFDLTTILDTSDEWIMERSGIHARRTATGPFVDEQPVDHPDDGVGTTVSLAVDAGRQALQSAGVAGADVDLLILCTTTPDQLIPASSAAAAAALGITRGAMDLNAACAGFSYGLVTAAGFVCSGAQRVLLIGAETLTRAVDWSDRTNAFLFGDGAGAFVLESIAGEGSLLGWDLGVDGSLAELLYADHGSKIVMNGREVFRRAVRVTVESAKAALERAKVSPEELALFVPHQANSRIMEAVAERLGVGDERIASVIEWTGNTSSASIPLALIEAASKGRLADGDLVLLAGFGAGMTWSSVVWRWTGGAVVPVP